MSFSSTREAGKKTVIVENVFGPAVGPLMPADQGRRQAAVQATRSNRTTRLSFGLPLFRGRIHSAAKAQLLFMMATQGRNVAAAIFWMKAVVAMIGDHPRMQGSQGKPALRSTAE